MGAGLQHQFSQFDSDTELESPNQTKTPPAVPTGFNSQNSNFQMNKLQ